MLSSSQLSNHRRQCTCVSSVHRAINQRQFRLYSTPEPTSLARRPETLASMGHVAVSVVGGWGTMFDSLFWTSQNRQEIPPEEIGQAHLAIHQSPILLAFINYTADLLISICQLLALYFSTVSEFRQRRERGDIYGVH